jgi:hypothetical protein
VRLDELPQRNVTAPKPNTPRGFHNHLARRWAEGCTSGRDLLLEIRQLGYTGSLSHLGRLLAGWRRAGRPVTVDAITTATPLLLDPLTGHLVSPIVAAALCVKPRGLRTDAQAAKVDAFKAISPAFATMRALAMRFRGILGGGDVESSLPGCMTPIIRHFMAFVASSIRCARISRRFAMRSPKPGATVRQKVRSTG